MKVKEYFPITARAQEFDRLLIKKNRSFYVTEQVKKSL